jgi:hypothetical protein
MTYELLSSTLGVVFFASSELQTKVYEAAAMGSVMVGQQLSMLLTGVSPIDGMLMTHIENISTAMISMPTVTADRKNVLGTWIQDGKQMWRGTVEKVQYYYSNCVTVRKLLLMMAVARNFTTFDMQDLRQIVGPLMERSDASGPNATIQRHLGRWVEEVLASAWNAPIIIPNISECEQKVRIVAPWMKPNYEAASMHEILGACQWIVGADYPAVTSCYLTVMFLCGLQIIGFDIEFCDDTYEGNARNAVIITKDVSAYKQSRKEFIADPNVAISAIPGDLNITAEGDHAEAYLEYTLSKIINVQHQSLIRNQIKLLACKWSQVRILTDNKALFINIERGSSSVLIGGNVYDDGSVLRGIDRVPPDLRLDEITRQIGCRCENVTLPVCWHQILINFIRIRAYCYLVHWSGGKVGPRLVVPSDWNLHWNDQFYSEVLAYVMASFVGISPRQLGSVNPGIIGYSTAGWTVLYNGLTILSTNLKDMLKPVMVQMVPVGVAQAEVVFIANSQIAGHAPNVLHRAPEMVCSTVKGGQDQYSFYELSNINGNEAILTTYFGIGTGWQHATNIIYTCSAIIQSNYLLNCTHTIYERSVHAVPLDIGEMNRPFITGHRVVYRVHGRETLRAGLAGLLFSESASRVVVMEIV